MSAPTFDLPLPHHRVSDPSLGDSVQDTGVSERATAQVIALGDLTDLPSVGKVPILDPADNPLLAVKARLHVSVGEANISVRDLLATREHQVLVLDRGVDQPVDVLLEGRVVARGQLVAVDDKFGVRITELPFALRA